MRKTKTKMTVGHCHRYLLFDWQHFSLLIPHYFAAAQYLFLVSVVFAGTDLPLKPLQVILQIYLSGNLSPFSEVYCSNWTTCVNGLRIPRTRPSRRLV